MHQQCKLSIKSCIHSIYKYNQASILCTNSKDIFTSYKQYFTASSQGSVYDNYSNRVLKDHIEFPGKMPQQPFYMTTNDVVYFDKYGIQCRQEFDGVVFHMGLEIHGNSGESEELWD